MAYVIMTLGYFPGIKQRQMSSEARRSFAEKIATTEGLRWKYWLISKDDDKHCGIYLFNSIDLARLAGSRLMASLEELGATGIDLRFYDVDAECSAITRGALP